MEFRVLGPVALCTHDAWQVPGGTLQRTLLGNLLAQANETLSADQLIDALWGGQPDDAATGRLHLHVHRLRKELDTPARLTHGNGGYSLHVDADELDALAFDDLAATALAPEAGPGEVWGLTHQALALWNGIPYDGVAGAVCTSERSRLEQRQVNLLGARFEAGISLGRHLEVLEDLRSVAAQHPLDERLQELLVTALDRAGRRSDALAAFRRTRGVLVEELGVDPGPRLQMLHERILIGEHPTDDTVPTPNQAPMPPSLLLGREDALTGLDDALLDPVRRRQVIVVGTAGVGKSALALTWAHAHQDAFPDGTLYCDLRGFGAEDHVAPGQALAGFIRALGESVPADASLDELSAQFRSLVSHRRFLVVLDDAGSVEQVRPLLPSVGACAVLVTSRVSLNGLAVRESALLLGLPPLSADAAADVLHHSMGLALEDRLWGDEQQEITRELADLCARLPLALRIVSEQLRDKPVSEARAFVRTLRREEARLDKLDLGDESSSVRAVLHWSYGSLPATAQRTLRAFGNLPGPVADVGGVAALADQSRPQTQGALRLLERYHLVDRLHEDLYGQHGLLRAFAMERAVEETERGDRVEARSRLLSYYAETSLAARDQISPGARASSGPPMGPEGPGPLLPDFPDATGARHWIEEQLLSILAAVRDAGPDIRVANVARGIGNHLSTIGAAGTAMDLYAAALESAVLEGDEPLQVQLLRMLGAGHAQQGNHHRGEVLLRESIDRALALDDQLAAAASMNNLAVSLCHRGADDEGVRWLRSGLEVSTACEDADMVLIFQGNLADRLAHLGRLDEALDLVDEVLGTTTVDAHRKATAHALQVRGQVHLARGDATQATRAAGEALEVARAGGLHYRESEIHHLLGQVALDQESPAAALGHFEDALAAARRVSHVVIRMQAVRGCGEALLELGSPDAPSYLDEARSLARLAGDHREEAQLTALLDTARSRLTNAGSKV